MSSNYFKMKIIKPTLLLEEIYGDQQVNNLYDFSL